MPPFPAATAEQVRRIGASARAVLEGNILPFWLALEDREFGGHFEAVDAGGRLFPAAPKTAVFVARMLWTLSNAACRFGHSACAEQAHRTRRFLRRFRDPGPSGGYFAAVRHDGEPLRLAKHLYAQAFVIFGLAGYFRWSGDETAAADAIDLFSTVQRRARHQEAGVYREAFDATWREIRNHDRALGETVAPHTADTHLHLVEACTELFRAVPREEVRTALRDLVTAFVSRFIAPGGSYTHQKLDDRLSPLPGTIWPGHDIEASWLLADAAEALGDEALASVVQDAARRLSAGAVTHGADGTGGWAERVRGGVREPWRLWWVQAEAVHGTMRLGLNAGDSRLIEQSCATWGFIERHMVDRVAGDWRLRVGADGAPDPACPRVVFWKDAYHQARACMELAERCGPAG